MRAKGITRSSSSFKRRYNRYTFYDDSGRGPFHRFLYHGPNQMYPTRRVIVLLFIGACLSTVGVQITEDEHLFGPLIHNYTYKTTLPIHLAFEDLGCALNGLEEPVLEGVTGEIKPGRLTAILGPSGSGKTTFLLQLLGRGEKHCTKRSYGNVFVNGEIGNLESVLDWVGFVPQNDVLYAELTVLEALETSATWRLPRNIPPADRYRIINETIDVLDLGHIRHQRIGDEKTGGISGGERKRTSVGMELVAMTSVLIMDEPTSGLDSASAFALMRMLRKVVNTGVSVIAVLHQPYERIFELVDDVVLIQKGKAAYIGEREGVLPYLSSLGYDVPAHGVCGRKTSEYVLDVLAELEVPTNGACQDLAASFKQYAQYNFSALYANKMVASENTTGLGSWLACDGVDSLLCNLWNRSSKRKRQMMAQRPNPGLRQQTHNWLYKILLPVSWRKGVWQEIKAIASLAAVVGYVRSYNKSFTSRAHSNMFLSLSIGLLGMFGAVLNDDIGPVKRAASAGLLLGAHEFAVLALGIFRSMLSSLIYALVYFTILYLRNGVWIYELPNDTHSRYDALRVAKFTEFWHMLNLNYLASSAIGSCICVCVHHNIADAYVTAIAVLLSLHVLSFHSPNKNQINKDTFILAKYDLSWLVRNLCLLSYVSYFLEAIMLWDPDTSDMNGRNYVLRYYGYSEQNKTYSCMYMFCIWTLCQGLRYIVFGLLNSNHFHSLYDTPLFLNFIFKVLACHVVTLVLMTLGQELMFPLKRNDKEESQNSMVDILS